MDYEGGIIEESLDDKSVLRLVEIRGTRVEKVTAHHKTPWLRQWTIHTVRVREGDADAVAEALSKSLSTEHSSNWYADFKNDMVHYVIYRNKVFKLRRDDRRGYAEATKYGISLGIPPYQVDFSPEADEWKR